MKSNEQKQFSVCFPWELLADVSNYPGLIPNESSTYNCQSSFEPRILIVSSIPFWLIKGFAKR